jgi:hypothetical protein
MPSKKSQPWTEAEEQKLMDLSAQGRSALSIAAALHRTTGAVNSRASIVRARDKQSATDRPDLERGDAGAGSGDR